MRPSGIIAGRRFPKALRTLGYSRLSWGFQRFLFRKPIGKQLGTGYTDGPKSLPHFIPPAVHSLIRSLHKPP
jgi:hypothetical protein